MSSTDHWVCSVVSKDQTGTIIALYLSDLVWPNFLAAASQVWPSEQMQAMWPSGLLQTLSNLLEKLQATSDHFCRFYLWQIFSADWTLGKSSPHWSFVWSFSLFWFRPASAWTVGLSPANLQDLPAPLGRKTLKCHTVSALITGFSMLKHSWSI